VTVGDRIRQEGPAWVVGAMLFAAGLLKAGRPLDFGRVIEGYQLLPPVAVPLVAAWLPWLEVATGALLAAGPWRLGAAAIATLCSAGFLLAGGSVLVRGLTVTCGCFGAWSGPVGWGSLALEAALLGLSVAALREAWRRAAMADVQRAS
jgi:hypothetical protein